MNNALFLLFLLVSAIFLGSTVYVSNSIDNSRFELERLYAEFSNETLEKYERNLYLESCVLTEERLQGLNPNFPIDADCWRFVGDSDE